MDHKHLNFYYPAFMYQCKQNTVPLKLRCPKVWF